LLDQSIRTAILALHSKGQSIRAIARAMKLSRGAVRLVIRTGTAEVPRAPRAERAEPHEEEIRELYARNKGNLVRVHEELVAAGASLSYQALTGFCRRRGIGQEPRRPAGRYHFEPGQEMQHDTSQHMAYLGGVLRKVGLREVVWVETSQKVEPYSPRRHDLLLREVLLPRADSMTN